MTNFTTYWIILSCSIISWQNCNKYQFTPGVLHGPFHVDAFLGLLSAVTILIFLSGYNRVGQSREIYSNSVPLSPPHWPYPKRIRPPSWPRMAVASSIQNTKLFTWRTWPGAGAVPKCDWAARSQCGFKQRRADHTKYIWYVATHGQSVITTELMIAWIWWRGWLCIISSVIVWKMTIWFFHTHM